MENFGKRLRRLRKERGLTQDDIAAAIGVSRQIISRWERNEAVPKAGNLTALADTLGISADYLLHGKTNFPATPEIPVEVPLNEQILEIAELAEAVLEAEEPNAPFLTVTSVPAPEVLSLLSENNFEEEIAESKLADEIPEKKKRKRLKWTLAEKIIVAISLSIIILIITSVLYVCFKIFRIISATSKRSDSFATYHIIIFTSDVVVIFFSIVALFIASVISVIIVFVRRKRKKAKYLKEKPNDK